MRTFGTAAVSARQRFAWVWSRESLLRLALSFVLAIALWLYITSKQDPNLAQDFPQPLQIEPVNYASNLAVTMSVNTVHVKYRSDAAGAIVTAVNFHPFVDLAGFRPGPPRYVAVSVVPDPGIHVTQVSPSRILVSVDRIETRTLPVTATILTSAPPGFTVGEIRLNPATISITGAHSLVSEVSGATVEMGLQGVTSSLDNSYTPVLRDSQGRLVTGSSRITINPPQIQVHVPISPLSSVKSLPILVPLRGQVKAGYNVVSVTTSPGEITARGTPSMLSRVNSTSTTPVKLTGRQRTFSQRVPLQRRIGITSSTTTVIVTVGIQRVRG